MELIYLLYLFIGIALGALAVFFAMRSQVQAGKERIALTEQQKQQEGDALRQQMRDGRESLQQQLRSQRVRSKSRNNSRWRSRWHSCASR